MPPIIEDEISPVSINLAKTVPLDIQRLPFEICPQAPIRLSSFEPEKKDKPLKINHCYLSYFCTVLTLASSMQMGWALAENGQVGFVLREKFGWSPNLESIMTITAPIGVSIGSQIGGKIANRFGIRRVMIWSNILGAFSCILKIFILD